MSRSPTKTSSSAEMLAYDAGWSAINRLIRAGRSFSGHERNCAYLNLGQQRFANVSSATGLDLDDDARGLALVDWDHDGDLDFWISNRTAPRVRFLRNDNPPGNHFLVVRLEGTGPTTPRDAIGARVDLYLAGASTPLIRTLYAGSGYLSQSSRWIHFGLGGAEQIEKLIVRWPGGQAQTFTGLEADGRYRLVQGTPQAIAWRPPRGSIRLAASTPQVPALSDRARVVLLEPAPLPELDYVDLAGERRPIAPEAGRPLLVNLWTSTCRACLVELGEGQRHESELAAAKIDILALCGDAPEAPDDQRRAEIGQAVERLGIAQRVGLTSRRTIDLLEAISRSFIGRQSPLVSPSSFLVDPQGRVAVIYKGPVSAGQLRADVALLGASPERIRDGAVPFVGRWQDPLPATSARALTLTLVDWEMFDEASRYARKLIERYQGDLAAADSAAKARRQQDLVLLYKLLGALAFDAARPAEARSAYEQALAIDPHNRLVQYEMVKTLLRLDQKAAAAEHLERILQAHRDDPEKLAELAALRAQLKQPAEAIALFRESLSMAPTPEVHWSLAKLLRESGQTAEAIESYRAALKLRPGWPPAANDLAWILATHPDDKLRDGTEAVRLAEAANAASGDRVPALLSTLAVAYAEAGRFEEAIRTAKQAVELARRGGEGPLAERLRARVELFAAGKPYRERPPKLE